MGSGKGQRSGVIGDLADGLAVMAVVGLIVVGGLAAMIFGKQAWYSAWGVTPEMQLLEAAARGDVAAMREAERLRGSFEWSQDNLGATAMVQAMAGAHEPAVRWLLDHGVRVDERDSLEQTPLMRACDRGSDELVRLLLMRGADVEHRDAWGNTAADYLTAYNALQACQDRESEASRAASHGLGRLE